MKHKSRRFLALFMAFNMAFSATYATFFPGAVIQAKAQESTMEDQADGGGQNVSATSDGQEDTADEEGVYILPGIEVTASVDEDEFPDNDTLFEQYVDSVFGIEEDDVPDLTDEFKTQSSSNGRETSVSVPAMMANVYFTGQDRIIYDNFVPKIKQIANGELNSAILTVPLSDLLEKTEYTAEELGVTQIITEAGKIDSVASAALWAKLNYDTGAIGKTLMRNYPYEMYWMQKTSVEVDGKEIGGWKSQKPDVGASWNGSDKTSAKIYLSGDVIFYFSVDPQFSVTGAMGTYDVDTEKTGAATSSAANAQAIVDAAAAKTDYDKLVYYKDQICGLVSYNKGAADGGVAGMGTMSPWQLIYVFDENPDTNVVCEGYSKAFQYLCDLTDFNSNKIYAYSLTGTMSGGTGAGGHMWNHVHMDDGKNYMVDVTNCDDKSAGNPDKLFMQGYDTPYYNTSEVMVGYAINVSNSSTIKYIYDSDMLTAYTTDELTLPDSDYVAALKHLTNVPSALDACVGTTITDDLLASYADWKWDTGAAGTAVPNTVGGTLVRTAVYNGSDKAEYDNTEANVTITAAAHNFNAQGICTRCGMKNIAVYPADGSIHVSTVYYTGSEQTVSITVDGLAVDTDYTVSGVTSGTNVGTYTATLTGTGSYTGTRNVTWTISYYSADAEAELAYEWSGLDNVSENILTAPTGYTVSLTPGSGYVTSVNLPASGEHVYSEGDNSISYYLQQTSTGYIIPGTVIVKIDMTNPVLSKAMVADKNITDTEALLEITAADTGSGIETYFVLFGTEEISGTGGSLVSRIKEAGKEYGVGMVSLTDLTPNTVYYYAICVTDQAGLVSTPVKGSFQTNKTATEITSQPTISGTYGQTVSQMLKAGVVKAGDMTVTGTWSVAEAIADTKLNAGTTEQITVTFVPTDSAYEQATAQVTPNVEKATPALTGIQRTTAGVLYNSQKAGEVGITGTANGADEVVTGTFAMKVPNVLLTGGTHTYTVVFTPNEAYLQNYNTAEAEISLTVEENVLKSISITQEPTDKNYVYGDELNTEGMTIQAHYANGDTADVTDDVMYTAKLSVGQVTVTFTYVHGGVEKTCSLTGLTVEKATPVLTGIQRTTTGALYNSQKAGEVGITGTANGTHEEVTGTFAMKSPDAFLTAGAHNYTVVFTPDETYLQNYNTAEAEISLTVIENVLESILITKEPTAKNYVYGDELNIDGMMIQALYTNGDTVDVTNDVTYTAELSVGQKTVTFTYMYEGVEKTCSLTGLTVEKATPVLKGIKRTSGTTLYHTMKQGDVELAGTADGVDESVPGTFTLKDPDAYLSVGTNTYPVIFIPQESYRQNYSTAEGEITLTVVKNALLSIEIVNEPVKKNYVYGETMDLTGMTVKALYSSGDKVNVTQVVTCERTLAAGQTKLTIYYTEGGVTQSCELTGLNVEKADPTYTLPAGLTGICGTKLGDVALPSGFAWKADTDTVLRIATEAVGADGSTVIADAQTGKVSLEVVYTPEDTVNYNVVTDVVSVQLTHKETIKNAQKETCIADGYTGDVYCEECGIKLSGGQTVSATGLHDFTKQGSEGICAVCGIVSLKLYAGIDVSVEDIYFDGKEHSADVIVTCDGKPLTVGADYTISGAVQTKAGAYEIAIAGTGNYTDTISVAWNIIPIGLWCAEIPDQVYTGSAIKPEVDVYQGSTLLTYGTDYTLSYANNINAGDATVTVKGKGNYAGTETATFKILPVQLSDLSVPQELSVAYTGSAQSIALTILFEGKALKADQDYKLSMSTVTAVGNYSVTVTGMGNYTGTAPVLVHVTEGKPVNKLKISKIAKQNYNDGREVTPAVTVKDGKTELTEGTHYTLTYADNRQVGTAIVTITGIGDYAGSSTLTFQIAGTPISKAKVEGLTSPTYTGAQVQQTAANSVLGEVSKSGSIQGGTYRVTYGDKVLTEGIDFMVSYQKNEKAGTATILFTGMGGYTGTMKKTFKILPYAVQGGTQSAAGGVSTIKGGLVTVTVADAVYAKGGAKPGLDIVFAGEAGTKQLKEGTDYTVICKNNKALYAKASSAADSKAPVAVIKFKGNFSGTVNAYYAITPQQLGNLNLVAEDKMPSTKKNAWKQTKVKIVDLDGKALKAGTDYDKTLVYTLADGTELNDESVAEAGTEIFVTAKGLGNYAGSELVGSYRIVNTLISKAKVTVDIQEYTGDPVEPKPSSVTLGGIALKEGDYEIIGYANNVKKGTASMTIHGTGAYGGTKVVKFKIGTKRLQWSAK